MPPVTVSIPLTNLPKDDIGYIEHSHEIVTWLDENAGEDWCPIRYKYLKTYEIRVRDETIAVMVRLRFG